LSKSKKKSDSKHCPHWGKNPCCCPTPSTPSKIQFAFAESQEELVVPERSETTIISLPITTSGQNVKLDLSFEIRLISPPSDFVVDFRFHLRRNGSILVQPRIQEVLVSPGVYSRVIALTFVDVPPPGTQTYDVVISNFLEVPFVVEFRALTATLYPPENVLPSTNL
jgi:hypothetical protein